MTQKKRILVVEDNEINRSILCAILEDTYEVLEAENGQVALDILKQQHEYITLILLDVSMPVMDGYTFLNITQKDEQLSLIPVIVMPQESSEEDELSALVHGATDFLPKPYRPQVILHRVANLIRLRETAAMVNQLQYDELTGLYTRNCFYRKARERLDENPDKEYMILCTNLENFKLFNDTFGRKAGDQLLLDSAEIFQKRVGQDSICCRYNADRFVCLIDKELEQIGRKNFADGRKSKRSELTENISVKLGVYAITDRSISVEQMCDRALLAVDSIKGLYNQYFAVYDDTLREKLLYEKEITDSMEKALEQEQFVVYFQPKYSLHDNSMVGAEALVRWEHPQKGFMPPDRFIPLFEKNGFIHNLDRYVWEKACQKLQEWRSNDYPKIPVSVNVSRADIYQHHFVESMCELVKKYGIEPSDLHLEITESAYTECPDQIISTVEELRKHGFIIEMDDFGSGYSSLSLLSQLSIDILKLDMDFIRNELAKPVEQSILNDVINMAHRMHLNVVAEGVETNDHKKRLKVLGCDYAQGYYFAKPMPALEFEALLKMYKSVFCGMATDVCLLDKSALMKDLCGAKRTVLVVEDNELNRNSLTEILETQYIVLTAENGKEGLEILKKNGQHITAIMLDIQMPVMNGYEFLEHVSGDPVFSKIPVIVTTVFGSVSEEEKCLALGASDFIGKPYNAKSILTRLGNIIHLRECDNIISELEIDVLTGFKNRKAYYEEVERIENDPEQNKRSIGVVFADINGLKTVNDSQGHDAGDHLIEEIARAIRSVFTDANIYRLGGDEFVILSFEESEDAFSEKLKTLESCWKEGCSAALGGVWLEQAKELEQHVALADQAMYRDKSQYYEKNHRDRRSGTKIRAGNMIRTQKQNTTSVQETILQGLGAVYYSVLLVDYLNDRVTVYRHEGEDGRDIADNFAKYDFHWTEGIEQYCLNLVSEDSKDVLFKALSVENLSGAKKGFSVNYQKKTAGGLLYLEASVSFVNKNDGGRVAVIGTRNVKNTVRHAKALSGTLQMISDAVATLYPLVAVINLTKNSFRLAAYSEHINQLGETGGSVDELIMIGAAFLPNQEEAETYRQTFCRENLLRAFHSGEKQLVLYHDQVGDDGQIHRMETRVVFTGGEDEDLHAILLQGRS